jgi:putative endonuclease
MIRWLKSLWSNLKPAEPLSANREAGERGEHAAAGFLKARQGYVIVTRNWRSSKDQRDEIDLVCRDRDVLVFVEVKARAAGALVNGFQAVDERKRRALRRAVQAYLAELNPPPRTFRFDIVEVTLSGRLPAQVMHYENAPLFPKGYHLARQAAPESDK